MAEKLDPRSMLTRRKADRDKTSLHEKRNRNGIEMEFRGREMTIIWIEKNLVILDALLWIV